MLQHRFWTFVVFGALALPLPPAARAAEATDSCDFFINSVPALATAAGTYCLTADLATSDASYAILAEANVTIDCLGHVLDGSGRGTISQAVGVLSSDQNNVTVRNCHLRGFGTGVSLKGSGNVVEDNLIENVRGAGIRVIGNNYTIRRNRVAEVGGSSVLGSATGISGQGSGLIADNDIAGVDQAPGISGNNLGISAYSTEGTVVVGNRIRGIGTGNTQSYGMVVGGDAGQRVSIRGNDIVGEGGVGSTGLLCTSTNQRARNNTISGFVTGITTCANSAGNVIRP